jgi:hypothetical protein
MENSNDQDEEWNRNDDDGWDYQGVEDWTMGSGELQGNGDWQAKGQGSGKRNGKPKQPGKESF